MSSGSEQDLVDTQLVFVNLLKKYQILLQKSQVPATKIKKEKEAKLLAQEYAEKTKEAVMTTAQVSI